MKNSTRISNLINPHILTKVSLQVFWALDQLENSKQDRFSIKEIVNFLIENKKAGINVSENAVRMALLRNKSAVHISKDGLVKLMQKGRAELDKVLSSKENVVYVEPGKPFSGKKVTSQKVLTKLKGEIRVCDPYCGNGLLYLLSENFTTTTPIKIITANIIDKPAGSFHAALKDLRSEGYDIEIKVYTHSILHDRYLIDDNNAWLSGNSFNELGKRESFMVLLGSDVRQSLLSTYNSRWRSVPNSI